MATPLRDTAWLQWIAKLMEPGEPESAPGPGSRGFECRLEDQPDHLVPEYAIRDQERNGLSNRQLFLNPDCWIGINDRMPPEIDRESFDLLCPANENQFTAWVRDPGCGATMPFRLSANLAQLVRIGGDHAFDSRLVRPGTYSALQHCGLLVANHWKESRVQQWAAAVYRGREEFLHKRYVPVRRLIHPFHLSALRAYYRAMIRTGKMVLGDGQCARRYVAYNETVARFFHRQLTPAVSAFAGEALKPSYVYVGSYQAGARLEKHTDREQCEFSLTFCLDYSPEPELATPWPIQLHTGGGTKTIFQALGDGLLYRGREIPHSRSSLPAGHTSTSIFFHYVRSDFGGELN
jgi:hypothetical protein